MIRCFGEAAGCRRHSSSARAATDVPSAWTGRGSSGAETICVVRHVSTPAGAKGHETAKGGASAVLQPVCLCLSPVLMGNTNKLIVKT